MPFKSSIKTSGLGAGGLSLVYAAFAGLWILVTDNLLGMLIGDPALAQKLNLGKGFMFVTVTAALLYLLLRTQVPSSARTIEMEQAPPQPRPLRLLLVFGALGMVVPLISFGIIHLHGPHMQQTAYEDLRAIAGLKARQMDFWLNERRGDAEIMASSMGFIESVAAMLRSDPVARERVLARLDRLKQIFAYETDIYDSSGRKVYSTFIHDDTSDLELKKHLENSLHSGRVQYRDIYRDGKGQIHLEFVIPLLLGNPADGSRAVGNLVMHAPAEHFLYPLIDTWPTSSASAETLLVRRDGNRLRLLSEFHHTRALQPEQAPIEVDLSGAEDREQVLETKDYRGATVLAAIQPVPGTPWSIIAKIDRDEVVAPLRALAFWVSVVSLFATACLGAAFFML